MWDSSERKDAVPPPPPPPPLAEEAFSVLVTGPLLSTVVAFLSLFLLKPSMALSKPDLGSAVPPRAGCKREGGETRHFERRAGRTPAAGGGGGGGPAAGGGGGGGPLAADGGGGGAGAGGGGGAVNQEVSVGATSQRVTEGKRRQQHHPRRFLRSKLCKQR